MTIQETDHLIVYSEFDQLPAMLRWAYSAGIQDGCEVVGITDVASLGEVLSPYAVLVIDRLTRAKLPKETRRLLAEKSLWVYEFSDNSYIGELHGNLITKTTVAKQASRGLVAH